MQHGKANLSNTKNRTGKQETKGKRFAFALMFLLVSVLAGCTILREVSITDSGNVVTQEKAFSGFDEVEVSNAFAVEISQGDTFNVVIRIDDNLVQYLEVVKPGHTLKIGLKPGRRYSIRNATMEAEITMPELTRLDLSGASHGSISGFKSTKALDVDLSGASHLVGDIEAGDARFDVSGASLVTVYASGRLDVKASGDSHVYYLGRPMLGRVDTSGASSVERKLGCCF